MTTFPARDQLAVLASGASPHESGSSDDQNSPVGPLVDVSRRGRPSTKSEEAGISLREVSVRSGVSNHSAAQSVRSGPSAMGFSDVPSTASAQSKMHAALRGQPGRHATR